jgi:hypothetical protein
VRIVGASLATNGALSTALSRRDPERLDNSVLVAIFEE